MKKTVLHILILLIINALVFSCSSNRSQNEKDGIITLKIWETYKDEHDLFVKIIAEFEKYYFEKYGEKIKIISDRVPFDNIIENIKTACQVNTTPDIARLDSGKILELAYHKVLAQLDTLPCFEAKSIEEKKKHYLPGPFETNIIKVKDSNGEWNDHLFGLPEQATCVALIWNKTMFKEKADELKKAGLDPNRAPVDWDEAVEYGKILTIPSKKQYGFAFDNNLWFAFPFFNLYGAEFVGIDNNKKFYCAINSPLGVAALQKKIDLCSKQYNIEGKMTTIEAGSWKGGIGPDQGFINNNFAMIIMGAWYLKTFEKTVKDFGVSLIPKVSKKEAVALGMIPSTSTDEEYNKKITTATNLGGNNLVIFKSCERRGEKYVKAAYEFINYFTSKEVQLRWGQELNQIPVNIEAFEIYKNNPKLTDREKAFVEQVFYSKPSPKVPLSEKMYDVANVEMEQALNGKKTAKEALDKVVEKLNKEVFSLMNE
ncbi:extracellular solute-binding protein [Candidatus Dependentiae bacterium]|nr:extracellular solute-binding protein [Candidatus Dependentiae bacterium]